MKQLCYEKRVKSSTQKFKDVWDVGEVEVRDPDLDSLCWSEKTGMYANVDGIRNPFSAE